VEVLTIISSQIIVIISKVKIKVISVCRNKLDICFVTGIIKVDRQSSSCQLSPENRSRAPTILYASK